MTKSNKSNGKKMSSSSRMAIRPSTKPPFPEPGSTIGPEEQYFCLGRLGRGTFCSIHKCVDLSYSHRQVNDSKTKQKNNQFRIVAAKVELSTFTNSGVLDGEATVLEHLSREMPHHMIPTFIDYVHSKPGGGSGSGGTGEGSGISAIIMEYLAGEDMHNLRDRHCQSLASSASANNHHSGASSSSQQHRRVSVRDAVYLTRGVILPLLQAMHDCGVIHRDVKPSNCVRTGRRFSDREFKLVDFGLSKSFVVPSDSGYADLRFPWDHSHDPPHMNDTTAATIPNGPYENGNAGAKRRRTWMIPPTGPPATEPNANSGALTPSSETIGTPAPAMRGCLRKERPDADFRGTSMYASLRVHQSRDYCRRDDIWGLLFVFCDLVSGGLPWMAHAANRDRNMCRIIKEWVHGERKSIRDDADDNAHDGDGKKDDDEDKQETTDRIEELLKGADHHLSKHRREEILRVAAAKESQKLAASSANPSLSSSQPKLPTLIPPLNMSHDKIKIEALRKAFRHVSQLEFADEPDYQLISDCLQTFLDSEQQTNDPNNSHNTEKDREIPPIDWEQPTPQQLEKRRHERNKSSRYNTDTNDNDANLITTPDFTLLDPKDRDPLKESTLIEAEKDRQSAILAAQATLQAAGENNSNSTNTAEAAASSAGAASLHSNTDFAMLPLPLQLRLAQVEYNALHPTTIPVHLALRDWMALGIWLVYGPWDSAKYEKGNHRTNDDGYRREVYMKLTQLCLDCAEPFGRFCCRECFFEVENDDGNASGRRQLKRRKISVVPRDNEEEEECRDEMDEDEEEERNGIKEEEAMNGMYHNYNHKNGSHFRSDNNKNTSLLEFSKVMYALRASLEEEKEKTFAPPPAISFGSDIGSKMDT